MIGEIDVIVGIQISRVELDFKVKDNKTHWKKRNQPVSLVLFYRLLVEQPSGIQMRNMSGNSNSNLILFK